MVSFGAVFGTRIGRPLSYRKLARGYNGRLHKAGQLDTRFHELRHTACSLMVLRGVPATVAMKCMGHSDIRLTLQLYTDVLEQKDMDAAARLDALLV